ncbi:hypothetical protein [Avibacterium paragallinarum]|uniref:PRD domain-containing protein n=1 Tax=Avibacterium paragallinarum TaxID=728 RepID=A0AAE5WIX8_AVIPA|nr:hypothetical protein [Avibacterium paragallinarum]MEE3607522.1 hypothetical protein [Avibacterium paragallinarum]MEE3620102.1 hypothetical protein [Avibacterium paragallinarum]MEE3667786.1 hypothetical protein [Avibacterium paragallinarum]MEE3680014.1 hypothetical protein [Avibacterium paragallinarum]MEE4386449.1 hypothetical protein [Avibacterium paragallinarum]
MELQQQLTFLLQRKLIDEEIVQWILHIQEHLITQWHADVDNRQVFMLFNHLAMALGRIKRGYIANPLDAEILSEIQSAVAFPQIFQRHSELLALIPLIIPENEQTHLIANIYALSLTQPHILDSF